MEDGDYLGAYERFFNEFVKRINPNDQLPVKMSGHEINSEEVIGEVIDLSLQYLNQKYCPPSLQSFIVCLVIEEMKPIFKNQPEICGLRPEKNTYAPLKLMQAVTKKINEICQRYLENSRLALLPPPPSTPFPITSVFAIKNNRRKMEDRHVVLHDLNTIFKIDDDYPASYYAVFDGHAGQDAAVYCATHLHQYLAESIYYPSNIEHALRDAFITTDAHFIQKCKKHALSSGTTAVCAIISNKKFYVAWVGDSQAVLVKRNNVKQLVNSHRPDRSDEKERIEEMGGLVLHYGMWRVNGDLAVSRAIGDPKYKPYVTSEPEMYSGDLDGTEDFLIIACDGLWDYVNEVTAAKLVYEQISRDCHNIEAISHCLGEYSKSQGSSDNITVIIVFLTPPDQIVAKQFDAHSLSTDVNTINMEVNNRHMSDPNSQYDVDTEFMEQQFYNKNDSAFDDNASYDKSSTISQDGRTLGYEDGKNDDLGPETNVDTLDDAGDNCTLVNASRELFSNEKSDNNLTVGNELGDTFSCPSNNTNEHVNITSVDNVGDSDESDDEWNFYRIEPNQETENSLQPKVSSVVSEVGEEIVEPEILENYKDLLSDEKVNLCNQNTKKSEEKESFFSPDKPEISENNEDLLLPETQDNCSEEMDFSLNPNAAEFVPVSSPPSIPSRFMDLPISGSPLKQTSMMDDINLPSPKEFKEEASHRPHEVEEEDNETISLNGNAFTGENIEEFDEKKKTALNLDESEISSTRAEFGDESNISFLATDFQKASGFDGSFTESCTEYESDPMAMSMGPDGFNLLSNPVDLNAIHDLNDSDLCDINSLCEEKEQTLTPVDDDHSQPLDFKSPDSNELQLTSTSLEHENTNNNIMCTLSPSEELNVKDIENNTDEIISQVAAMNLKNEQLSEVCLENTNDFTNNTDNIKNDDQTQDDSPLTEQKPGEFLFLESQHVPLENVEIHKPQNKFDSSFENCLISCDESKNLEHHQEEINLTDQCNENTFSDSDKLASHDSINTQVITKSEPAFNNECEFKNEEQEKNKEKDNVLDVSVSDNFTDVLVDMVPTKAQNGENSIIEKENTDITVSPRKSMELSKSLQEFTGLEKELSPTENNKDLMENISHEISEKSQIQDTLTTKDAIVENSEKSLDQTTEPSPEKIKVSAVEAKNTTAVAAKTKSNKISSRTITKTSATKSSTRVTPAALAKPLVGVVSRSNNSSADAKKVTVVGVAGNSIDASKASTLNKPSSKPGIKSAPRLTSVSQSKSSATKVPLTTNNTEKKSTVTTNGDSKANKIPPKSRTSTVDVPSKPLVKSTVSSVRLTTTTKSKSSVGTTESKPGLKTTVEVKSSGINIRPKTAPSALTTTKSRTLNPAKPSIVDKNVKETANKQISNRTTSTTNSRASNQGLHSTTTTVSATTKRSTTTVRTTKQQSSLTRTTAKNIKSSIKTNANKTQLPNNVNEIKNAKVIEESLSAATIVNAETVSEKDSSTPTIENQQIIGQEL